MLWLLVMGSVQASQKPEALYLFPGNYVGILDNPVSPGRDGQHTPFRLLSRVVRSMGIGYERLEYANMEQKIPANAKLIYFDVPVDQFPRFSHDPTDKPVLFLWEPPTVNIFNWSRPWIHRLFSKVYTLFDDFVDNERYFKFYEPQPIFFEPNLMPGFPERKLCTIMSGNKKALTPRELYSERRSFSRYIRFVEPLALDYHGIVLPLSDWGWYVQREDADIEKMHKGKAPFKIECYKNYKFAIIYENMRGRPGYLTAEKLLFPMMAGCVPIYWGADNVEEYVPRGCFIDRRDFSGDEELFNFIVSFNEADYGDFLRRVEDYMNGGRHLVFSPENLVDIVVSSIYPEYPHGSVFDIAELNKLYEAKKVMDEMGHLPGHELKIQERIEPGYKILKV